MIRFFAADNLDDTHYQNRFWHRYIFADISNYS